MYAEVQETDGEQGVWELKREPACRHACFEGIPYAPGHENVARIKLDTVGRNSTDPCGVRTPTKVRLGMAASISNQLC